MEVANGATAPAEALNNGAADGGFKLKFSTVCASNQNRSVLSSISKIHVRVSD